MLIRSRFPGLFAAIFTILAVGTIAQTGQSRVAGRVTDGSGGALPGATVTIVPAGSPFPQPVEVTTAAGGEYLTPWLPPGDYALTFTLSGFDSRSVSKLKLIAGETLALDVQLSVAALKETVEVTAPFLPPPDPPKPAPPPPRPRANPVDPEILASVCGPRQSPDYSIAVGQIVGRGDDPLRGLIGPGDLVQLSAGESQGLTAGQNLVVRRRFQTGERWVSKKVATFAEQTAGLVQVLEVHPQSSVAMVVYQCGELIAGDSVEPYQPQLAVATQAGGTPKFDEPARIITGEDGQEMGAVRQMMVIDRGIMQGVARGQRLTIFRRMSGDRPPVMLGDGVVVAVRSDSATFRIERAKDAITVGDLVAIHR
jgi:hypothetical protein